jgi:plasmid stabilization system protein ParE
MAFKIIYTESALADLEAILDYILVDNPAAASRFGNDLLNHVDLLAAFPHIGSPVKRRTGMRKILHTPVRVYYRIHEERRCVEILHFWHAARQERDWV